MCSLSQLVLHSRRKASLTIQKVTFTRKGLRTLKLRALTMPYQYVRAENSSYSTLCSSGKAVKMRDKLIVQQNCFMSQDYQELPAFYAREMKIVEEIKSKYRVQDLLEFYLFWKQEGSLVSSIATLHSIAEIVKENRKEREILEEERGKSMDGTDNAYSEILDFISNHISWCKGQGLANVMWSLGVIREKDHSLVKVCEKEIVLRDVTSFHRAEICCQILPGCAALELKGSAVFQRVEQAILTEKIKLHLCENRHVAAIPLAFWKVGRGSVELFQKLEANVVERDFVSMHNGELCELLQGFAFKAGVFSEQLFSQGEREILRRTPANFRKIELMRFPRAFAIADKGSVELFAAFAEEISKKGIRYFPLACLCWISWSFALRGMTQSKVFKFATQAIAMRGVKNLRNWELALCLYSYVLSEIPFKLFLKELAKEVLARDLGTFHGTQLCQLLWSSSKAEYLNPELLHRLEEEVLKRNLTEEEERIISEILGNANKGDETLLSYLRDISIASI